MAERRNQNKGNNAGIAGDAIFPNAQKFQGGDTMSGKRVLESGFNQQGYIEGSGHLTPENIRDGLPMKDTPHPHTGEDIFGGY